MSQDLTRDLKALQELPLLPHTFERVMRLLDNPRTSEHKLADAIGQDPALTLKVLRLANSPYYGASGQVAGLDEAIGLIGMNSVRGLLLSLHLLQSHLETVRPLLERFAHHGYATARAARVIARMLRRSHVSVLTTAALLHDLGYLCRLQAYPEVAEYGQWEGRLAEEERTGGGDHHQWGHGAARAWNLPDEISEAILHHPEPRPALPHFAVTAVVHAGDVLCRQRGLSPVAAAGPASLTPAVAEFLGLSAEQWDQIEAETRLALQQTGWLPGTSSLLEQAKP